MEFPFTMETYVFEQVLTHGQGSNDPPFLSIYYSKHKLQTNCQERRTVTSMTMNDSNWDFHLQWKSIDLKDYFRSIHGCTIDNLFINLLL